MCFPVKSNHHRCMDIPEGCLKKLRCVLKVFPESSKNPVTHIFNLFLMLHYSLCVPCSFCATQLKKTKNIYFLENVKKIIIMAKYSNTFYI